MAPLPDPAALKTFEHAAAGHDGVLTDEDNTIVVKPCTAAEIAFYESANAQHPRLAYFMPRFLGTLNLDTTHPPSTPGVSTVASSAKANTAPQLQGRAQSLTDPPRAELSIPEPLRLKGKALETSTCIVLSAITAGFKRPNVLDLKLGSRLWADDAPPAKRVRLDKVSGETTSGSLGFRIAGMRTWRGRKQDAPHQEGVSDGNASVPIDTDAVSVDQATNYLIYNKLYGRTLNRDDIHTGFANYFLVRSAGVEARQAERLVRHIRDEVSEIIDELSNLESRMYSSSILLVYEGDPQAYQLALEAEEARWAKQAKLAESGKGHERNSNDALAGEEEEEDEGEDEDEDEGEELKSSYAVKLIDFAHATWVPGEGPDQNLLRGLRGILTVLDELRQTLPNVTHA